MGARALVIGIDRYRDPAWNLTGAVDDALRFASWALRRGDVAPEALTLLLSPADPATLAARLDAAGIPATVPTPEEPTRERLRDVFFAYEEGLGQDADRLWFFYAGHGTSPVAGGPTAGPVVVPCDVQDLRKYLRFDALGLEVWRGKMSTQAPPVQLFFVDACREVLQPSGPSEVAQQLVWDIPRIQTESTQAVVFAAAAGQQARELYGRGLFNAALLLGLAGRGPKLDEPVAAVQPPRYCLPFDALADFVKKRVSERVKDAALGAGAEQEARGIAPFGSLTVATFAPNELPTAKLTVRVGPREARAGGMVEFVRWDRDAAEYVTRKQPAPVDAIPQVLRFDLAVGEHFLRVRSPGWIEQVRALTIFEDTTIVVDLEPDPRAGLESSAKPKKNNALNLESVDRMGRITVMDVDGGEIATGTGTLDLRDLAAGPYRVRVDVPGRLPRESLVQAAWPAAARKVLRLGPTPRAIDLQPMLSALNVRVDPDEGVFFPAEDFGAVATLSISSLLAYAAWGARWPQGQLFHLREIGVDPIRPPPGQGAVQVLFGDRDGQLKRAAVLVVEGAPLLGAQPLPRAPELAQAAMALPPGSRLVRIVADGFGPVWVPISCLEGFVSTVVVAREPGQAVEIHQYLQPGDPTKPFPGDVAPPDVQAVRFTEAAWRSLEERRPIDAEDRKQLGAAGLLDPLATVATCYRFVLGGHASELTTHRTASGRGVLDILLEHYPALPDVHVLAAFTDPARADDHFDRAAQLGLPLLGYGAQAMLDHLGSRSPRPELSRAPVPGATWTVLVDIPEDSPVQVVGWRRAPYAVGPDDPMLEIAARLRHGADMPDGAAARVGDRVAVVGPTSAPIGPPTQALAPIYRTIPAGDVVVVEGRIMAADGDGFEHDCPTVDGMQGAPVVRVRDGKVVGRHVSGDGRRGRAVRA